MSLRVKPASEKDGSCPWTRGHREGWKGGSKPPLTAFPPANPARPFSVLLEVPP